MKQHITLHRARNVPKVKGWGHHRPQHGHRPSHRMNSTLQEEKGEVEMEAKQKLMASLVGASRGADLSLEKRAIIEEAQTDLEATGEPVDFDNLEGLWRLCYTTSLDLLPIFWFGSTRLASIGDIYQRFGKPDNDNKGKVQNIIEAGVLPFLEDNKGVTLRVSACYKIRSGRRITLTFEEVEVSDIKLNDLARTLLAPAMLPRGFQNMRALQSISEFKFSAPLQNPFSESFRSTVGRPTLLLTYLDEDLLIGRSIPGSGIYILERVNDEQ